MTTYTSSLRMILPDSGALVNTWGTVLNASLINLIDSSIAGYTVVSISDTDTTLTTANGSGDQARMAFLNCTGALTANRNLFAPAVSKEYVVVNSTTGNFSVVVKVVGGAGTGITIPAGQSMKVWTDGTNFYESVKYLSAPYIGTLSVSGAATFAGTTTANGQFVANSGIVLGAGNFTGSTTGSAYTFAGGNTYNNGGGIALYGSTATGSPGTIQFFGGTGATNNSYGSFAANGTFNVVGAATIGQTLSITGLTSGSQFSANVSGSGGQYLAVSGSTVGILRNDGNNFYILKNNASTTAYDAARPITINLSTGNVVMDATGSGGTSVGGTFGVTGSSTFTGAATFNGGATVGTVLTANGVAGTSTSAFVITNTMGAGYGAGWYMNNSTGGATNPNKWFRLNSIGGLEIINSAYNTVITTLTDGGALTVTGAVGASQFNGSGAGLTGTASSLTSGACSGNATTASAAAGSTFFTSGSGTENDIGCNLSGYNPAYLFNSTTGWGLYSASGGVIITYNRASGTVSTAALYNTQTSSLGVGTGPTGVVGQIVATNNITAYYSDNRLKTRFENIPGALDSVKKLNGFYYEANATAQALGYEVKREIGVSAQEVEALYPEIVAPAPIDNQYLTVHYERLVPILIEAIKELSAKVEALEARLG